MPYPPPSAGQNFFGARRLCLRIGECIRFGCTDLQTQQAAALVRRIVREDQRKRRAIEANREIRSRQAKIVAAPGRFQRISIAVAHQQFALDLAQDAIRRAYVVARGGDPQDVPDAVSDVPIISSRYRLPKMFPKQEPPAFTRANDVVDAHQIIDIVDTEREVLRPEWRQVVRIKTQIVTRLPPHKNVGRVVIRIPASSLPLDVIEALTGTNLRTRREVRYLVNAVRELEMKTWDREDAVEDVGGKK